MIGIEIDDTEKKDQIDTFWECVKKCDILVAWQRGGYIGRDGEQDTLWAYIYAEKVGEFMDWYLPDIEDYIDCRMMACGAVGVNLTLEDLNMMLDATDDEIWERRPEGCRKDW